MSGILSATPSPASARLAVGALLLTLVQMLLVIGSASGIAVMLRIIVVLTALVVIGALLAAIRGEPASGIGPGRRHRHGR